MLEPGGPHVMLRRLTQKLEAGTTMPLTLVFEHAGEVTLEVPVEGIMAGTGPGHDARWITASTGATEGRSQRRPRAPNRRECHRTDRTIAAASSSDLP